MVRVIKEKTDGKEQLYVCVNPYIIYCTPICTSSQELKLPPCSLAFFYVVMDT
jgi:hypothetical protein